MLPINNVAIFISKHWQIPPRTLFFLSSMPGFLNLGNTGIFSQIILCFRGCAVHCVMFYSISISPIAVTNGSVSRHCQMFKTTALCQLTSMVLEPSSQLIISRKPLIINPFGTFIYMYLWRVPHKNFICFVFSKFDINILKTKAVSSF